MTGTTDLIGATTAATVSPSPVRGGPPMTQESRRALVVEDEHQLSDVLARVLRRDEWDVRTAASGAAALEIAASFRPHAVILDIGLPDMDGHDVLRRLRVLDPAVSVLFLTARDAVADRIGGILAGADDYVTKPFSLDEVAARLRGLLRRATTAGASGSRVTVGDLALDEDTREVTRAGVPIDLTVTEFDLLRYLMLNPRKVLAKSNILANVWNYDFGGNAHVVELYISYLRKKIDAGREPMIHTVRGLGYMIKPAIPA